MVRATGVLAILAALALPSDLVAEDANHVVLVGIPRLRCGRAPGRDEELKDRTHHNSYGAYELARCVVTGIRKHVPELAKHLTDDAGQFDPARPDDPELFTLPRSPISRPPDKPAGN
ncbi:MAG: hypothetical protein KDB14_13455 [Planctomycetales bacterium]|nr:hypothetical protein [Planctomycetales bacterium]